MLSRSLGYDQYVLDVLPGDVFRVIEIYKYEQVGFYTFSIRTYTKAFFYYVLSNGIFELTYTDSTIISIIQVTRVTSERTPDV